MLILQQIHHIQISLLHFTLYHLGRQLLQLLLDLLHIILSYLTLSRRKILLLHLQNFTSSCVHHLLLLLCIDLLHSHLYVQVTK